MKIKTLLGFLLVVIFATAGMTSCKEEADGPCTPIEWGSNVNNDEPVHELSVPAEGGSYRFECKNYYVFWLENLKINDEYFPSDNLENIRGEWVTATVEKMCSM